MFPISFASDNNSPDSRLQSRHLVYTGQYEDGRIALIIHIDGKCTTPHLCYAFWLKDGGEELDMRKYYISPRITLMEHGWVQDPHLFATICANQAASNLSAGEAFANWRKAALATLETNHGPLWVPI